MNDHDQIAELLGAYALDAVEEDERALVEAHLEVCEECRSEVDRHRAVASLLSISSEPAPASLWDRVREEIEPGPGAEHASVTPLRRRWMPAAAAAAVAAVLAGVVVIQTNRITRLDTELAAANQTVVELEATIAAGDLDPVAELVASSPEAMVLTLTGPAGNGTVVLLPDGTGFLLRHDLEPLPPSERTYQLWAVQAGEVISAGILGADPEVVAFHVDPATLEGLVITEEEAGGVAVSEQPAAAAWFPET